MSLKRRFLDFFGKVKKVMNILDGCGEEIVVEITSVTDCQMKSVLCEIVKCYYYKKEEK